MEKFVVLAGRRSGTTLLANSLDSHPQIECTKETFSTKRRWKYFQIDRPNSPFYKFRSASLKRQIDYLFRRKQLIDTFLNQEFNAPANGVDARGIRLSYEQAHKYPEILEWILDHEVKVIHLIRENSLKAILSQFTAKKRAVYHVTSKVERVTVQVPPYKLKKLLTKRTNNIETYRRMFQTHSYCEIFYETFVADQEAETRRLLNFLHVDHFVPLTSNLVKQNSDSLKDILENYDEVVQAFKGTAFEKYF